MRVGVVSMDMDVDDTAGWRSAGHHSPQGGALSAELRNYCSKLGLYFVDGSIKFCFEDADFQWVMQSCCVNNIDVYYFVWWLASVALHANWLHRRC